MPRFQSLSLSLALSHSGALPLPFDCSRLSLWTFSTTGPSEPTSCSSSSKAATSSTACAPKPVYNILHFRRTSLTACAPKPVQNFTCSICMRAKTNKKRRVACSLTPLDLYLFLDVVYACLAHAHDLLASLSACAFDPLPSPMHACARVRVISVRRGRGAGLGERPPRRLGPLGHARDRAPRPQGDPIERRAAPRRFRIYIILGEICGHL